MWTIFLIVLLLVLKMIPTSNLKVTRVVTVLCHTEVEIKCHISESSFSLRAMMYGVESSI